MAIIIAVSSIAYAGSLATGNQLSKASPPGVLVTIEGAQENFTLASAQGALAISEAASYQQSAIAARIAALAAQLANETDPQKRAAITAQISSWSQLSSTLDQLSSLIQAEYEQELQPTSNTFPGVSGIAPTNASVDFLVAMSGASLDTGSAFYTALNASLTAAGNLTQALKTYTSQSSGGLSIAEMLKLQQQMNLLEMSANLGSALMSTMAKQLVDMRVSSSALLDADRSSYFIQALNSTVAQASGSSYNMSATAQLLQAQVRSLTDQLGNITLPSGATQSQLAEMSKQMASINTRLSVLNQALQTLNSEVMESVVQAQSI